MNSIGGGCVCVVGGGALQYSGWYGSQDGGRTYQLGGRRLESLGRSYASGARLSSPVNHSLGARWPLILLSLRLCRRLSSTSTSWRTRSAASARGWRSCRGPRRRLRWRRAVVRPAARAQLRRRQLRRRALRPRSLRSASPDPGAPWRSRRRRGALAIGCPRALRRGPLALRSRGGQCPGTRPTIQAVGVSPTPPAGRVGLPGALRLPQRALRLPGICFGGPGRQGLRRAARRSGPILPAVARVPRPPRAPSLCPERLRRLHGYGRAVPG